MNGYTSQWIEITPETPANEVVVMLRFDDAILFGVRSDGEWLEGTPVWSLVSAGRYSFATVARSANPLQPLPTLDATT